MAEEHYDYVAWRDGFVVAVCVDNPKWKKDTARSIAEWVRKGCTIERMTHAQFNEIPREKLFKRKPKTEPQLGLLAPPPRRCPVADVGTCARCDLRPLGAEGTIYCQPCLDWQREDYAAMAIGTPRPTWDPFDPDDVEAHYGTPTAPEVQG